MKLISARSLKPAILVDFASNILLSSLAVLPVSSSARIKVENKWQGILRFFQRIEFSMFLGYLVINWKSTYQCLIQWHFKPSGKKKTLYVPPPLQKFASFTPLYPLEFLWPSGGGGMDIFWNHRLPTWSILKKKSVSYIDSFSTFPLWRWQVCLWKSEVYTWSLEVWWLWWLRRSIRWSRMP